MNNKDEVLAANVLTHCNIGVTVAMAGVTGTKPTIEYLCRQYTGGYIYDSLICIQTDGAVPAGVNCPQCRQIGELLGNGHSLSVARRLARKKVDVC